MAHPGRPRKCDPRVEALGYNIRQGDFTTARSTLQLFGIDATDGEARTALINTVIENKLDFVQWLLENGANVNHQDRIGYSALYFAVQEKFIGIIKYLLQKGADPNLKNIYGNTPFMEAVHYSFVEPDMVNLLLKEGADPDIVNNAGVSPRDLYKTIHEKELEV